MTTDTINPNQALWEKGDFSRIAVTMRERGEALVAELGITAGSRVLDLGCGDGTTALPAARLGADVLGVDMEAGSYNGNSVNKRGATRSRNPVHPAYRLALKSLKLPDSCRRVAWTLDA